MVDLAQMSKELIILIMKDLDPKSLFEMSQTSKQMNELAGKAWKEGGQDFEILQKRAKEMGAICTRNKQRIESALLNLESLKSANVAPEKIALVAPKISESLLGWKKELVRNIAWFDEMLSQLAKQRKQVKGEASEVKAQIQALAKLESLITASVKEAKDMADTVTQARKVIEGMLK